MAIRYALLLSVGAAVLAAGSVASHSASFLQQVPADDDDDGAEEDAENSDTPSEDDDDDDTTEDAEDGDTPSEDDDDDAAEDAQDGDTSSDDDADAAADGVKDTNEGADEQADAQTDGSEINDQPVVPSPEIIVLWSNPPRDEYEIEAVQFDDIRYIERCTNRRYCEETRKIVLNDLAELLVDYLAMSLRSRREDTPKFIDKSGFSKYTVSTGQKLELESGKPGPNDAEIWGQVARLVPITQSDKLIGKFQIFSEPNSNTIAFMDRDAATGRFLMGINDPVHLATDAQEQKLTIAHELMHMIVVNELVKPAAETAAALPCDGVIEPDEGCYKRGSIYADFVTRFWPQADRDAAANNVDLFEKKKGSFVTPYAATSPHEDIADSFSVWLINEGKGETVADAKQRFFGNYPNLVALKQQIRRSVIGDVLKERRRVAPRNTKPRG